MGPLLAGLPAGDERPGRVRPAAGFTYLVPGR